MGRLGSSGLGGPGLSRVASLLGGPGLEDNLDPERVFYALDDFSGSFVNDVIIGKGALTEARTSTIFLQDDAGIWQSFGSGVPGEVYANARWWLYGGPAGTNEIPFSSDLTDPAWDETGTAVAAFDAVGLEGAANTASTLTDDDGAAFEFVLENITIPDDSNSIVCRVFLKKDEDETRFPEIRLRLVNGTEQNIAYQINTKTGADNVRISTGSVNSEVNLQGDWWELLIEVTNNSTGNISGQVIIYPARATSLGELTNSATGSIIVGNVELHLNKTIAQVRGSTPIFTSGSTVSVDATDLSFDDANHADLEGAYFCEVKSVGLSSSDITGLVGVGGSGRMLHCTNNFRSFDGVNNTQGPVITLAPDDTEYKVGMAYGDSLKRVNTDDVFGAEDAYDGVFNNSLSKMAIFTDNSFSGGEIPVVALMRNLRRYDLPYLAAQAKIEELMS